MEADMEADTLGRRPTNPLVINPYSAHDFTTGLPTDGLSAYSSLIRLSKSCS